MGHPSSGQLQVYNKVTLNWIWEHCWNPCRVAVISFLLSLAGSLIIGKVWRFLLPSQSIPLPDYSSECVLDNRSLFERGGSGGSGMHFVVLYQIPLARKEITSSLSYFELKDLIVTLCELETTHSTGCVECIVPVLKFFMWLLCI